MAWPIGDSRYLRYGQAAFAFGMRLSDIGLLVRRAGLRSLRWEIKMGHGESELDVDIAELCEKRGIKVVLERDDGSQEAALCLSILLYGSEVWGLWGAR